MTTDVVTLNKPPRHLPRRIVVFATLLFFAVAVLMNTNGSESELTTIAGRLHAALAE